MAVAQRLERATYDRKVLGSNPPALLKKFGHFFNSTFFAGVFQMRHYKPLVPSIWCLCTESKISTGSKCVTCHALHILEEDNSVK